ncbi:hypothetical protein [uncultured Maribacter sp.]|uniref:hypothetical protein n=1 Tax=uncultured Maribacter sp. TaxID=431308 RepID=UPI00262CCE4D|nr:hypothetical protein [uncultured Maribacter sp.]
MNIYIQDIVNRLSQFSEKLDNTSMFIDKPWVLIDDETNYHKYIFKRNGELIMSMNGQVQIGKWEYLTAAKSLLIDRIKDKILLNQSFFDLAVMVLKVDGTNNELFILADEIIIPDLNIKKYLRSLEYKKFNILTGTLENGKTLEIHRGNSEALPEIGMKATIDGKTPENGRYKSQTSGRDYQIVEGKILKITNPRQYKTEEGLEIIVEQHFGHTLSKGDLVYLNSTLLKTGKYKIGKFKNLVIVNGVITKITLF